MSRQLSSFVYPGMVLQQIKLLLLGILGVLRRALCCLSRRRKSSHSLDDGSVEVLRNVVVEGNSAAPRQHRVQHAERDWNSWDDTPRTVEEHIEQYRQQIAKPPTPSKEEAEPDFFSELTPVIKPQLKVYLGGETQEQTNFSRLEAKTDVPIAMTAELEDWSDEDAGGWEQLDAEQAKQMLRETRRQKRQQRQKVSTGSNEAETQARRPLITRAMPQSASSGGYGNFGQPS